MKKTKIEHVTELDAVKFKVNYHSEIYTKEYVNMKKAIKFWIFPTQNKLRKMLGRELKQNWRMKLSFQLFPELTPVSNRFGHQCYHKVIRISRRTISCWNCAKLLKFVPLKAMNHIPSAETFGRIMEFMEIVRWSVFFKKLQYLGVF